MVCGNKRKRPRGILKWKESGIEPRRLRARDFGVCNETGGMGGEGSRVGGEMRDLVIEYSGSINSGVSFWKLEKGKVLP